MDYTIVTAFYLMKSKFHPDKYKEWISNFLQLNMNCILFTNQETKQWFGEWMDLSNKNIHLEILEIDDFITAKYDWNKQYEMDEEKNHSRELYMIWNEKINLLKISTEKNPYGTEWFLWCDMGSLRQSIFDKENFKNSSMLKNLDIHKTYFFRIPYTGVYRDKCFLNNLNKYLIRRCDLKIIQGGFILTNLSTCSKVHKEYYNLLDEKYNLNLFIGKDQYIYLSLVLQSIFIQVIEIYHHKFIQSFNDDWFFVYPFMLGCANYRMIQY